MEKINWKKELKRTGMEMLDGLYSVSCMGFMLISILHCQTEESLKALNILIQPENFSMVLTFFSGLAILGFALRYLITGIFLFIMFIIHLIITNKKQI